MSVSKDASERHHNADNSDPLDPQIRNPETLAEMVKKEVERAERESRDQRKQQDRRHEERTEASERNHEAMKAQRKADTDYARRRVEEARARATEVAPPVGDKTVKRQRKATTARSQRVRRSQRQLRSTS